MRKKTAGLLAAWALLGLVWPAAADDSPVILVLSGGGARGAAHVGVLKVLEDERIPIDGIVGTSMGALVGGLYASGLSAAELEDIVLDAEWGDLFLSRSERELESYRRKQDERDFLIRWKARLDRLRPTLPLGAIDGRHVVELLRASTARVAAVEEFSELPIPFRAIATDLETGQAVVLARGDLALSMRASMAVPGVFTPVEIDGRHLVDGGIAENLAIAVAASEGPARILAVDISSPPLAYEELGSAAGVVNQAVTLLMQRETERQLDLLDEDDLFIRPALGTFSSADFAHASEAIRIGEEAARALLPELRRLSVPDETYRAWRTERRAPPLGERVLTEVVLVGPSTAASRAVRRRLEARVGEVIDPLAVQREVERARASDLYESVDVATVPTGEGEARLEVRLPPRSEGHDHLLFTLRLFDDFAGGTDFDLGGRWVGRELGRHDLELRLDFRGGQRQVVSADVYRPVGERHVFFVGGGGGFREDPFALYVNDSLFFRLRRRDLFAHLDLGAPLGRWGEVRFGVEQRWSRLRRSSDEGIPVSEVQFDETLAFGRFGLDTLDHAVFPSRGTLVRAEVDRILATDLEEKDAAFGYLLAQQSLSASKLRMTAGVEAGDVLSGDVEYPRFAAGGLFRLSGYAEEELRGSRLLIGSVRAAWEVGGGSATMPIFLGGSVELGDVVAPELSLGWETLRWAGSLYLAVDSVLGPIHVYVGFAEEGRRSWGFSLGRQIF